MKYIRKITHHSSIKTIIQSLSCIFLTIILASPASALSETTFDFYNLNDIFYYDPTGTSSRCVVATGSYDGVVSNGLGPIQSGFVDTYHDIAQQLSVEYGIPWEAVMAQGIVESKAGTSAFAVNRNNFFGIGAFDSNPNNAHSFATPEEGWRGYFENIRKTATYRNHGVFQNNYDYAAHYSTYRHTTDGTDNNFPIRNNITNPYHYLQTVWDSFYASSAEYYQVVAPFIAAIENRAKEKGWATSAELAEQYPEMLKNAGDLSSGASDAPSSDVSYGSGECVQQGNGDLNETALKLSWPDNKHNVRDPNEAYSGALEELGIASKYAKDPDWSIAIGSSCDVFIATVMRYSGIDTNYPLFLREQIPYLKQHTELYQYVGRSDDPNIDYQPGDIRANRQHTEMIVRLENGQLGIASASHQDRTADHAGKLYNKNAAGAYDVYRHI